MKTLKPLFILFFSLIISACGGGNSSSDDSSAEATVTGENGATVTFSSNELTAGEVVTLSYNLGGEEFTGTIRWGDNTQDRVRGSGTVTHRYGTAGTFSVSVQIDGGESVRMGVVLVQSKVVEPVVVEPVVVVRPPLIPTSGSLSCAVAGNLTLQSSGGQTIQVEHTISGLGRFDIVIDSTVRFMSVLCPQNSSFLTAISGVNIRFRAGDPMIVYTAN